MIPPETPGSLPAPPAPTGPPTPPGPRRHAAVALAVGTVLTTIVVIVLATVKPDSKPAAAPLGSPTDTSSISSTAGTTAAEPTTTLDPGPSASPTPDPTTPESSDSGRPGGPTPPTALLTLPDLSSEMSSLQSGLGNLDMGTCLSGKLPDSTTAVAVGDDVKEVPCFESGAHYKVIQTFPGTADLSVCDKNPDTQFEFSSEQTTNGGITSTEYVYCLIGLGSYAR